MKEKKTHAGTKQMQYQARAASNANMTSATSREIIQRKKQAAQKQKERQKARVKRQVVLLQRNGEAYSLGQFLAAAACCVVLLGSCLFVLGGEAGLQERKREVISLQETYEELKTGNDIAETKILAGVSPEEMFQKATGDYGMHYPLKSQVIRYGAPESEHIKQNEEIP